MDAYDEIMRNNNGIFEEDVDDWNTDEDWEMGEKVEYSFCVGKKEAMSLARQSIRILANIRKND